MLRPRNDGGIESQCVWSRRGWRCALHRAVCGLYRRGDCGEGIHLRELGIDKPILVMGGTLPEQVSSFVQYDLTLAASSFELLDAAEQIAKTAKKKLKAHLKIDTGMERTGVHEYEAEAFIEKSLTCSHLDIEGIFTHFANSESNDLTHAKLQLERFQEVLNIYEKRSMPRPPIRHTANSGAILQLPESHFDMVRPGAMFMGFIRGTR